MMNEHENFYIIEDEDGEVKVLVSNAHHPVGSTYSYSSHPSVPGTTSTVVDGPFELPEPMPHVLAVKRWLRFERSDLYAEHFDIEDEWVTGQMDGKILCEKCGEWFEPEVSDAADTEFGTFEYFQHTDQICSEACREAHVFSFRN